MKNVPILFTNFTAKVKKHKKLSAVLIIVLLFIVYFGLRQLIRTNMPTYQTAKVERGVIVSSVTASGQIVATNGVTVTTQASGIVKEIFVVNGTQVNAGDKILELTLDSQGQQKASATWSSYLLAKTTLDSANATFYSLQSDMFTKWKKYIDLATNSTYENSDKTPKEDNRTAAEFHIAQDDWFSTEAKYKNQQAVIGQAQAAVSSAWQSYQLVSATVVASVSGLISDLIYAKGMSITSSTTAQKVATIRNSGKIVAQFNLSELDVAKVKSGQKANVTIDASPSKNFRGVVIGVDTSGVITTGVTNYPATVEFDGGENQIFSNMAANVSIVIDEKKQSLIVPSVAVQDQDGKTFVRVRRNGKIEQIPVVTGLTSDTETEIIKGISDGEEVIIGVVNKFSRAIPSRSPFNTQPRGFNAGGR